MIVPIGMVVSGSGLGGAKAIQSEERRHRIVELARASFVAQGYAGTTMSAVAAKMGGSKGTLWSYFATKEELFEAVVIDVTAAYRREVMTLLDTSADVGRTIERFALSFIKLLTSEQALGFTKLVIGESGRFPELGAIFHERAISMVHELVSDYLAARMSEGALPAADPRRGAQLIVGLCLSDQHRLLWGVALPPRREEEEAAFVSSIFMRAFGATPALPAG